MSDSDSRKAAIELPKSYDEEIACKLPLSWQWDKRYYDSLPYIFTFSVAVTALNCKVGDLVLDFACGSGWISEWLNRLGIRTVSMDISTVLLNFAKKRMMADSRINLEEIPAHFVAGEGDMFPFADETFDGIICMNSLHHMPDYQLVLNEMCRVLKKNGAASFAEPGNVHSKATLSVTEVNASGVLEKDVVLSEVYAMALKAGFADLRIKPYVLPADTGFSYYDWQRFLNKMPSVTDDYFHHLSAYVEASNLLFTLNKSARPDIRDCRRPGVLKADIEAVNVTAPFSLSPGQEMILRVRIKNTGDTIWLKAFNRYGGYIVLSARIFSASGDTAVPVFEEHAPLPLDLHPGDIGELDVRIVAPDKKGGYAVKIDLINEKKSWFEEGGSKPLFLDMEVK